MRRLRFVAAAADWHSQVIRTVVTLVLLAALSPSIRAQNTFYVDHSATGAGTGISWTDAFVSLQDALASASSGDDIWVAAGIYHPDEGASQMLNDKNAAFALTTGVKLYGGFAGGEMARSARDWEANVTVLSGDLLGNDPKEIDFDTESPEREDNSINVVRVTSSVEEPAPVLDGFQITGGNVGSGAGIFIAVDSHADLRNLMIYHNAAASAGGGIANVGGTFTLSDSRLVRNKAEAGAGLVTVQENIPPPTISRTVFEENIADGVCGGGVWFRDSADSSVEPILVRDVTFLRNRADEGGGVCLNGGFSPTRDTSRVVFIGTRFIENAAIRFAGGGLASNDAAPEIVNSVFIGNRAEGDNPYGGAIMVAKRSLLIIRNSTLTGNTAEDGAGIYFSLGMADISNSIIWNNPAANGAGFTFGPVSESAQQEALIQYSLIENGLPSAKEIDGDHILDTDPLFVDAAGMDGVFGTFDDDVHLQSESPAIDAGVNNLLPVDTFDLDGDGDMEESLPIDMDGHVRVLDGGAGVSVVDLGAFEFDATANSMRPPPELPSPIGALCTILPPSPNPVTHRATFEVHSRIAAPVTLSIFDSLGRRSGTIYQGRIDSISPRLFRLEAASLPSGVFHLVVIGGSGRFFCHRSFIVRR